MRRFLILGVLLCAASPALAQPPGEDDGWNGEEMVVPDGRQVDDAARRMDRLIGAIMDLPIGGIVAAVDPEGRGEYGRGDTVRDMAERDDPGAEARIRYGIRGASRSVGMMSQAFARAMPALRRSIQEIERSMATAIDEADGYRGD
jgi:hypothetical protein